MDGGDIAAGNPLPTYDLTRQVVYHFVLWSVTTVVF